MHGLVVILYNNCYFDIEVQDKVKKGGSLRDAKISVICTWIDHEDKSLATDYNELFNHIPSLEMCDQLVGYNCKNFDIPILNNYMDTSDYKKKVFDIYDYLIKKRKLKVKLSDLTEPTFNMHKYNLGMPTYRAWQEQRIEDLKKFVAQDVLMTKSIWEFGHQFDYVLCRIGGRIKTIRVDW